MTERSNVLQFFSAEAVTLLPIALLHYHPGCSQSFGNLNVRIELQSFDARTSNSLSSW